MEGASFKEGKVSWWDKITGGISKVIGRVSLGEGTGYYSTATYIYRTDATV